LTEFDYAGDVRRVAEPDSGQEILQLIPVDAAPVDRRAASELGTREENYARPFAPRYLLSQGRSLLGTHGYRLGSFSAIGAFIFLAGLALQAGLTGGLHMAAIASYMIQAVASVEASFLLNRWITWRQRGTAFWPSFLRFNVQKGITVVLNLVMYGILLWFGVNYLVANVLLTIAFTVVNYVGGDRFVFTASGTKELAPSHDHAVLETSPEPDTSWPSLPAVSVVIPCKGNEKTIRATVESLLSQDYPELQEVILVGSPRDSTWAALMDVADPRLTIIEVISVPAGERDANYKRDCGIHQASGELISLVDSDIVLPPYWLSCAVTDLRDSKADCITGGMRSIHDTFWGRYVDCCRLSAKTPRGNGSYIVTAESFGAGGRKPPITANILFTRELYERCPIDSTWAYGSLEDYEWFWRLALAGHKVLVDDRLFGWHHHRSGWKRLGGEYRRSARGCASFIRHHRESPFARKRLRQAIVLPLAVIAALAGFTVAACGHLWQTAALTAIIVLAGVAMISVREFAKTRTFESLAYPVPALYLGVSYTTSLVFNLVRPVRLPAAIAAPMTSSALPARSGSRLSSSRKRSTAVAFAVTLGAGIALRLWRLASSPSWQWDETVYYRVSMNMQHGILTEHTLQGGTGQPFLYQPPFYFLLLSRWFDLTGASIYHARILGVLLVSAMFVVLYRLIVNIHGPRIALLALVPVVFDGWLLYVQRSSYMENALILIIVCGMYLYQQAMERPSWQRFAAAGLVLGFAAIFKQTGSYVIAVVLLCWLLRRRQHREHLVLLAATALVIISYVAVMAWRFDVPGHDWYIYQTTVQVRRVLGVQHSGGTLTSPTALLHLLFAQYKVFVPSFIAAISFVVITIRRIPSLYRARKNRQSPPNVLLLSWTIAGILVFGLSSLKFPQYFVLVLLPLYCLGWTELASWNRTDKWKTTVVACAVACGIASLLLSMVALRGNPFAQARQYAAADINPGSVVVTEQSIGDLINQPWCTVEVATPCLHTASYAITWQTYLQSSFTEGNAAFHQLMIGAVRVRSFTGAAGTVTVWKLRGPSSST
jgi:4-amino-4-deoxy-L-arabinose transferase-like glycosyltransferase/glycosyltransferase involved in cell wall biosynthesis/putative flippase GtrA